MLVLLRFQRNMVLNGLNRVYVLLSIPFRTYSVSVNQKFDVFLFMENLLIVFWVLYLSRGINYFWH